MRKNIYIYEQVMNYFVSFYGAAIENFQWRTSNITTIGH